MLAGVIGTTVILASSYKTSLPNLILHTVKYENIDLTIIERGSLESSENKDVTCMVKASKGGNFATTIKWVIDDGSAVTEGQLICELDKASLDDQLRTQIIAVSTAKSALITAKTNLQSTFEKNAESLLKANNVLRGASLDLEKFIGLPRHSLVDMPSSKRAHYIEEIENDLEKFLARHFAEFPRLDGEYQQLVDDVSGRIESAMADFDQTKDRAAYSQRMAIKGYVTQSQAQADDAKYDSSKESLKKLQTERRLLRTFNAQKTAQNYCSAMKEAEIALRRTQIEIKGSEESALADVNTKQLTFEQEQAKMNEVINQIRMCWIHSPQNGMVVYFVPEQARFGGGSQQSIVAQGEPVREGQKLLRIPNLKKMQAVARVHEAMISRVRADVMEATGFSQALRAGFLINRNFLPQLCLLNNDIYSPFKKSFLEHDTRLVASGLPARVRVDAFNNKILPGHVHFIASVATQDFFTPDVKVYQTVVTIDESIPGLRPGMNAEVTIQVENPDEKVLTVPIQAIFGGIEAGDRRKIFVMVDNLPVEREVRIGLSNTKVAEIREGLQENDQVVINPRDILGDKAKDLEPTAAEKGATGKFKGKGAGRGGRGGSGGPGMKQ